MKRKPHVEIFRRADAQYDWRLIGANGEQMCGSQQGYTREDHAVRGFLDCQDALNFTNIEIRYAGPDHE